MPFKILCLGDVMLGENINHIGRGIRTYFGNDFSKLIDPNVYNTLVEDINYIFYNFEYSINPDKRCHTDNYKDMVYISEKNSIQLFNNDLPKIVNIANNHFSQHGRQIAGYTKKVLRQNGFLIVGESRKPILIYNDGRTRIFFWGVSLVDDPNFCEEYFFSDYDRVYKELELHKKKEDEKWIISIHWGDEYISQPSKKQIKLAHELIEGGFDLIIGHHPHVIQPIEIFNNKIILYSLGNFIFDQNFSHKTQEGLAVKLKLDDLTLKVDKTYITIQKNYKISNIYIIKKLNLKVYNDFIYNFKFFILNKIYRILMKFEVLKNLKKVSKFTKKYYKNKFRII